MDNIFSLYHDLKNKTYIHGSYQVFNISDPKPRNIHKATARDRLLHHAVYRILYPYFDKKFISDSYSCRLEKGTHRAINQFRKYARKVSKNNTKQCWILKCDIKKFFASIDHNLLRYIVVKSIENQDINWLLGRVISSFNSTNLRHGGDESKGLPLGNLTSQLLANIYLNELDQFVKHKLKAKYYLRYADDFVLMHHNKTLLIENLAKTRIFLKDQLKLNLRPDKIFLKTLVSGVDFLGWLHFSHHRILRTSTKKGMFNRLKITNGKNETIQSYLGLLSHGNSWQLRQKIFNYHSVDREVRPR